ncbi:MAG TPA: 2-C-methyl-D-erythritol 4-phosphate cytidylyltransferase [Vitreimonas sp.]|nr:2-C-methyl-D-erythritol 4-phosphate cytidylyltransferase [Vitreimonas sp.]
MNAVGTSFADAIVVAAGSSRRMDGRDKLLAPIGGRPLIAWTLAALASSDVVERIVLVTAAERKDEWADAAWLPENVDSIVAGGDRRQDSVAAGFRELEALGVDDDRVVLVHDGARPLVSPLLVAAVAGATAEHGAAVPVLPVVETLKRVHGGRVTETVAREGLATAQTPQGARAGLLRTALAAADEARRTFTDEAAMLEACTIPVHAIHGDPDNFKVTLPADLDRAAAGLGAARPLVGFGHDGHGFGPGSPLALGGIEIEGAPRLHGHSDGDAVLHAVADALLGAAGQGDLGRLFPADDRTPRGIASEVLVGEVVRRLAASGLRPASVDVTIIAGRPRLAGRLDEMGRRIGELLGIDAAAVNVKASTGNLDGAEGAGRAVSARVVAVVERAR